MYGSRPEHGVQPKKPIAARKGTPKRGHRLVRAALTALLTVPKSAAPAVAS
ncbi:hypothetical protein [Streptomyces sp. NPDC046942]|uniref:hypothetical protein n=1 Tax=Streptomyces sp. NPDC046942 TaxID=3155137 RepID=UPI0033E32348